MNEHSFIVYQRDIHCVKRKGANRTEKPERFDIHSMNDHS